MVIAIVTRYTLLITKLPYNVKCGIVRAMEKPIKDDIVLLETIASYGLDVPPFNPLLDGETP